MNIVMKTTTTIAAVAFGAIISFAAIAGHGGGEGHGRGHGKNKIDTNGDGTISRQEAAARPLLSRNFDAIDSNRDGVLTRDEIKAYRKAHRDEFKAERKAHHEKRHHGEGK